MSAIERCRSAALGGHVLRCQDCDHVQIAYNSCRNRHCPKCQGSAAHRWLNARQADLLPVDYYHLVLEVVPKIKTVRQVYFLLNFHSNIEETEDAKKKTKPLPEF